MSDLVERLRARRVANWVHSTGDTPCCNGYALDAECIDAADTIEAQAERVRVLRVALQGLLAGEDAETTLEAYAAASERARAALEATQ